MYVRGLLLLICLFPLLSDAQKMNVTSMKETLDFIPGDDQRRDFNNNLCALLKVQVVDDVTDVEGNVMGSIINKGVEKWIYMAGGSKSVKIHLKSYLPVDVNFIKYNIKGLQGNRIYQIVMTPSPNIEEESRLDRVEMKDMSYILCKIVSVRGGYISFRQDEVEGTLKVPIKDVTRIKYVSGAVKKF